MKRRTWDWPTAIIIVLMILFTLWVLSGVVVK
jgi:hypothetical protein